MCSVLFTPNLALRFCAKSMTFLSHLSIDHFTRSVVEHQRDLEQTWDPGILFYWKAAASYRSVVFNSGVNKGLCCLEFSVGLFPVILAYFLISFGGACYTLGVWCSQSLEAAIGIWGLLYWHWLWSNLWSALGIRAFSQSGIKEYLCLYYHLGLVCAFLYKAVTILV